MLYALKNKYYIKTSKYYTEVTPEKNNKGDIILKPTKNTIPVDNCKLPFKKISLDDIKLQNDDVLEEQETFIEEDSKSKNTKKQYKPMFL